MESTEHPEQTGAREAKKETCLNIKIIRLLKIYQGWYYEGFYTINIYYLAKILSGHAKAGDDLTSLKWFNPQNLPLKKNGLY